MSIVRIGTKTLTTLVLLLFLGNSAHAQEDAMNKTDKSKHGMHKTIVQEKQSETTNEKQGEKSWLMAEWVKVKQKTR